MSPNSLCYCKTPYPQWSGHELPSMRAPSPSFWGDLKKTPSRIPPMKLDYQLRVGSEVPITRNLPKRFWSQARSGTHCLTAYNLPLLLTQGFVMPFLASDYGSFLLLGKYSREGTMPHDFCTHKRKHMTVLSLVPSLEGGSGQASPIYLLQGT